MDCRGLLIQFQEFTCTPDGVHQEVWLSVRPLVKNNLSNGIWTLQAQSLTSCMKAKVENNISKEIWTLQEYFTLPHTFPQTP